MKILNDNTSNNPVQGGGSTGSAASSSESSSIFDNEDFYDVFSEENDNDLFSDKDKEETWKTIEPEQDKFLLWDKGSYTFTTSDGTTITVEDLDGIEVKQNAKTGEIVVVGAKNATIKGSNSDVKINIYDSDIQDILMSGGNDSIYIKDSNVLNIVGGKGNDNIEINNSQVHSIQGQNGNDSIKISNNSKVDSISGNNGNDYILVEDSKVNKEISGGKNDDEIYVSNSEIGKINGEKGKDNISINTSNVDEINGGKDEDTILAISSEVGKTNGNQGNDIISANNSNIENLFGNQGADSIRITNSQVNITSDEKDTITDNSPTEETSPYEQYDETTIEQAKAITDNKTATFKNGEPLTPEEQTQALVINFFTDNLENMKAAFEAQENDDGVVNDGYNFVKGLLDLGVSREDIQYAIQEQEQMISELTSALNGESGESFEEAFKRLTGVEYNQENITQYYETAQLYSLAANGISKTLNFQNTIQNADNLEQVYNAYLEYYGNEDTAREKLNELLQEGFEKNPFAFNYQQVYIDENNQFVRRIPDNNGINGPDENTTYTTEVLDLEDVNNMIKSMPMYFNTDKYKDDFISQFETIIGKSFEEFQNDYTEQQLLCFGHGNSFQNLIDKYCAEQDGFKQKLATTAQLTGMGLMVVGGITTFVCPPVGAALLNAGKYVAISGMFSDNALNLIDQLSSENGMTKDEAMDLLKNTVQEIALLYSGMKINGVAYEAKDLVLNATQSKALSLLAEVGTDTALSLLTDFVITGEINLTSEGISQLLGIISGIAGAKIDAYNKQAISDADVLFKNNDVDGAYELLKSRGFSDKKIYNMYKETELSKCIDVYTKTGNFDEALKLAQQSKILGYQADKIEADLKARCANAEYTKILDMFYNGADTEFLMEYAKDTSVFDESDIAKIQENLDVRHSINMLYQKYNIDIDVNKYKNLDFSSEQNKLIKQDIEMMRIAAEKGLDVKDLMVPSAKSIDAGLQKAQVGDVFEVEGSDHIFIKTGDGTYEELNMSKDAYCKLFPPIDRYYAGQQYSGDCYLVSALNKMMATPETREKLLSCFNENEDGSISVKLPNSDHEIIIKPDQNINDLGIGNKQHVTGALGMQLLEYAYKVGLVDGKVSEQQVKLDRIYQDINRLYTENEEYFKQNGIGPNDYDKIIEFNNQKFNEIKEELKTKYGIDKDFTYEDIEGIIDCCDYAKNAFPQYKDKFYEALGKRLGINDRAILEEIANQYNFDNYPTTMYQETLSKIGEIKTEIDNMVSDPNLFEKLGGNGGSSKDVFNFFGIDSQHIATDSADFDTFIAKMQSNPDGYIATAGTVITKEKYQERYNDPDNENYKYYHDNPDIYAKLVAEAPSESDLPTGIVRNHAYGVELETNAAGEIIIKVTNPWDMSNDSQNKVIYLALEEFKKFFTHIDIGILQ